MIDGSALNAPSLILPIDLAGGAELALAGTDDQNGILTLAEAFHAEDGHPLSDLGRRAMRQLLTERHLGFVLGIRSQGTWIGYAALCFGFSIEWGGKDAFLDDFYIAKSMRGRGLGREVLGHLPGIARTFGCAALHLEVMDGNHAVALYKDLGFVDRASAFLSMPLDVT